MKDSYSFQWTVLSSELTAHAYAKGQRVDSRLLAGKKHPDDESQNRETCMNHILLFVFRAPHLSQNYTCRHLIFASGCLRTPVPS